MAAISHAAGLCLMGRSSIKCGMQKGAALEVCFGNGKGRKKGSCLNHGWVCKVDKREDGGGEVENPLDLEKEFRKALDSEESKALLQDLAAAAERVSAKRKELDEVTRGEKKVEVLQSFLERLDANQAAADSFVAEVEEEVLKAEAELKTAELALVMARAGDSATELSGKWEAEHIDDDVERIESGKAASVSALSGTLASLPFTIAIDGSLNLGAILSQAGILVSCALFGVTYRYAIRRDLRNWQLKSGVTAAFGIVRGVGYATEVLGSSSDMSIEKLLKAGLETGESVFIFVIAAAALDYCLQENLLSPFPSEKRF